jgi:hypothetical protein
VVYLVRSGGRLELRFFYIWKTSQAETNSTAAHYFLEVQVLLLCFFKQFVFASSSDEPMSTLGALLREEAAAGQGKLVQV